MLAATLLCTSANYLRIVPVLSQLLLGSMVISMTVIVQAIFIGVAETVLIRLGRWLLQPPHSVKTTISLIGVTLWLMAAHSIGVWIWAVAFLSLGVFESTEPALYFSVVSFTTLGFGDILLPVEWRILAGMSAANGLLIFGVSTAFLVELLSRVRRAQSNR